MADQNQVDNNPVSPIPQAAANAVPQATPAVSSAIGSPWDEDPSVPPAPVQQAPKVMGSLEPNSNSTQTASAVPFNVPENIEEKVGQKVPAKQYINPAAENQTGASVENLFTPEKSLPPAAVNNPVSPAPTVPVPNNPPLQKKESFFKTLFARKPKAVPAVNPGAPVAPANAVPMASGANPVLPVNKTRPKFAFIHNQKLIAVLGVIAFLAFIVSLTELGLVSVGAEKIYGAMGIEKFWGGLPANPENALAKSALQMQKHPNFKVKGDITLSVDTSIKSEITSPLFSILSQNTFATKDVNVAVSEPATKTAVFYSSDNSNSNADSSNSNSNDVYNLYSNSNASTDSSSLGSDLNSQIDSNVNSSDSSSSSSIDSSSLSTGSSNSEVSNIQDVKASISTKTSGEGISTDITTDSSSINLMLKNGNLLVKSDNNIKFSDNATPDKWLSYTIDKVKDKVIQKDIFGISADSGFSVKGKREVNEKAAGVRCYRYKIDSIEIGNALNSMGITSDMVQNISGNVWIGINDKLIRKITLKIITPVSSSVSSISVNLEFSDFDVENKLNFPADSEIIQPQGLSTATATTGSAANATSTDRDTKRKTDVNAILNALKQYKADNKTYPISKDLLKLNAGGNIIEKALVPKYLAQLPSDPTDGWYYAYKSNEGKNCSISARLENAADAEGQMIGGVLLFLKYNNE